MHKKTYLWMAIVVILSLLASTTAFAQTGGTPRGAFPVEAEVPGQALDKAAISGPVSVVVHLDKASLARVGKYMSAAERLQYAAEVAALQDQVAAQIAALGGVVVGRFKTLSSGLAVSIDASRVQDLRALAHVSAVRRIGNYELDLSDTVPFIGAKDVQDLGFDGTGVKVAILDDGVDYTHIKLGGPGTVEAYDACAADPTVIGEPDCPYFPNDKIVGGYDFTGGLWPNAPEAPDPDPIALSFHGTHVADIVGGLAGGGVGPGVAPGADLWMFKVCSEISSSCSGLALLMGTDAAADLDGDPATYDPADVINASIGAPYGQPEDDWTAFVNEAVAYGSVYVISAGNSSDKPFIVGSASTATAAISVAQTTVPSDKLYFIRINAPTPGLITNTAFQDWSVPLTETGAITGNVLYDTTNADTRRGCRADGSNPWTPGQFAGTNTILLVDRGVCAGSLKVANAGEAGAVMAIIALVAPGAPFSFAYGGGTITIPAFMVTQADGTLLKTPGTNITMDPDDPNLVLSLLDTMVGTSSRGPRNHDNRIKPDIGAPGGSISAEFGTGTGTTPFGGTSGAAPMVTGSAALLVQKYKAMPASIQQQLGPLFYKILLMNTANTMVFQDFYGGTLAPITRIGGGRVDVFSAFKSETIAWDSTDAWKDMRYNTGSMSFGYQPVTGVYTTLRMGTVANMSSEDRWYDLSASFRYAEDEEKGVTLKVIPKRLFVPAGETRNFKVKITIKAEALQDWPVFTSDALNKGFNGNNGAPLTRQEYDGYIHIDGGENNTVHLAWQVLPKKASTVAYSPRFLDLKFKDETKLRLTNRAKWQDADADVFALVDASPNIYRYKVFDDLSFIEACTGGTFPGGTPGPECNFTAVDLKEVGVRDFDNAYIEFGLTIWDSPFRASQFPVEFDIFIDSNRDGVDDWVVFNYDLALNGSDGRNVVFRCRANYTSCAAYFYTDSGVDTQNWILTVPAAAIGVAPGQAFNFQVFAIDGYFTGQVTDCSPGDCTSYHTYTMGVPKYAVDNLFPTVPAQDHLDLTVTKVPGGAEASPSQFGLLLLYRRAQIEQESEWVQVFP